MKNKALCFNCLGKGHNKLECFFRGKCRVEGCTGGHHTLLHKDRSKRYSSEKSAGASSISSSTHRRREGQSMNNNTEPKEIKEKESEPARDINALNSEVKPVTARTVLNVVPVYVFKNNGKVRLKCSALLDSGSNTTLISDGLRRKLGLHGVKSQHTYHQPIKNEQSREKLRS